MADIEVRANRSSKTRVSPSSIQFKNVEEADRPNKTTFRESNNDLFNTLAS